MMDFHKDFQFVISFDNASWSLPSGGSGEFIKSASVFASCATIAEVTDEHRQIKEDSVTRVWPPPSNRLDLTNLAEHKLDIQGHPSIKQRYYLVLEPVRQEMYKEVDELLESGRIKPS